MRGKRMRHTLRLYTILNAAKRTEYYKKNQIFKSMGENCLIMDRKVPLYAGLISIGNNVLIASDVMFITHDVTHSMLNNMDELIASRGGVKYSEKIGCIEIGDNVFVGAGTTINYDVRIGSNVIIGACSLITKDVPDNSVVAGVPAKFICTFDEYLKKRDSKEFPDLGNSAEEISASAESEAWQQFRRSRTSG